LGWTQSNPRDRLDQLRHELDSLSTVLDSYERSEQDLASRIRATDQKISTRQKLIRGLQQQLQREQRAVVHFDTRIGDANRRLVFVRDRLGKTNREVEELEEVVADRAVYLYKHGSRRTLQFLAAAADPGDLIRRRIYVEKITQRDARNLTQLRNARNRQAANERELQRTLEDLRISRKRKTEAAREVTKLVEETRGERKQLQRDRNNLASLLDDARRDRAAIEALIADREAALKQVEQWIASLESRRLEGGVQEITVAPRPGEYVVHEVPTFTSFSKGRGKLPWPVRGRVITTFGLHRNKVTGTQTENPGIDIDAKPGQEVLAVQAGVCKRITFLRGFGTVIMVGHEDGYYTVYAHMGEIWISEGETIEAGRVLGTVAPENSTGDVSLHFQVWHKRVKQNPLEWLSS
jgi:septal ring factor EnvC (AmiA/AmiB activator)